MTGAPIAWFRPPSEDAPDGEAVYGEHDPNVPGIDTGWLPAFAKAQQSVKTPAWECKPGGLKPLTQSQYEAQPETIRRHYTRIAAERQPLTDKQADQMWSAAWRAQPNRPASFDWYEAGLRDAERAHGIGSQPCR